MTLYERTIELKRLHDTIIESGDEDIYETWIALGVPDEPSEDDFISIAEDMIEYEAVRSIFKRLMKKVG